MMLIDRESETSDDKYQVGCGCLERSTEMKTQGFGLLGGSDLSGEMFKHGTKAQT